MAVLATLGDLVPHLIIGVVCVGAGVGFGILLSKWSAKRKGEDAVKRADELVKDAKKRAENLSKESELRAKEEIFQLRERFEKETQEARSELRGLERRLTKREDTLDRQSELLQQRENGLKKQQKEVERKLRNIDLKEKQLSIVMAQQKNQLLKITAMNMDEARELLLKRLEDECEHEMSSLIQRKVEETAETADEKSRMELENNDSSLCSSSSSVRLPR